LSAALTLFYGRLKRSIT